ncbi:dephospho-CoA kinase [Desulfococcus sp.]|uniref:dephospho-CoA kinase n=1 Tax=Desulfococcus sp. TaxID=2025834 RepID=UPI003593334E
MIIAGLTGGIATGKTTVAAFLRQAGAVIIDADRIARDAVRQGLPAWRNIVESFGREILQEDGEIHREKLGRIIFHDAGRKETLNQIVHPFVFEGMADQMKKIQEADPDAVVIQDIPLLFEAGMHHRLPRIIVVYIPEPLQIARLMERNHLSEADAMARIRSQISIEEKKKRADILIDNSGTLDQTRSRSLEVYALLKQSVPVDRAKSERNA